MFLKRFTTFRTSIKLSSDLNGFVFKFKTSSFPILVSVFRRNGYRIKIDDSIDFQRYAPYTLTNDYSNNAH
ncbi:hypothetical protein LEP1GSC194_2413 [Leptospira alstonii serovar Sichuan str. 79601]|uniref:Uncharacterized protein n=1 Tax=Leptospira alstonii serovar Sichuan str. 79601 TaxID=1218565 RepID=M6D2N7_9LEPT|nr:hypothetical protein LEP1GSC194_2413 [Leptospira alstonii serovar Sichuan str. 79601]